MTPRTSPGPLLLAVVLFVALCTTLLVAATAACDGRLTYALDSAYVHLSIARNVSQHATWGVTPDAFTPASAAPLWTALLSVATLISGPRPGWPLVLSLVAGLATLVMADRIVRLFAPRASRLATMAILACVVLFTPLAPLAFTGQEHLLVAACTLAFAMAAARALEEPEDLAPLGPRPDGLLAGYAVLLVAAGFEGLWVVLSAAILLALRGKHRLAWIATLGGLGPIMCYGMLSLSQGWFSLPTPLLLEGHVPSSLSTSAIPGIAAAEELFSAPHLLVLVVASFVLLGRTAPNAAPDRARALLLLFIGATLLHMQFARTGWMHGLAAHLAALGVVAVGVRLSTRHPFQFSFSSPIDISGAAAQADLVRRRRRTLLVLVVLVPLLHRGLLAIHRLPRMATRVYEQQMQLGRFLAGSYRGASVAVDDVGAVCWLAPVHCCDLMGFTSADVARQRMAGEWSAKSIDALTRSRHVRIAVLHEGAFASLPSSWQRVATWTLPAGEGQPPEVLSFFACEPGERAELERALDDFRDQLRRPVTAAFDRPKRRE